MTKKIYVGNLSFSCTEEMLRREFEKHGDVESARVITDRDTGRSKGFGFVEMKDDADANNAINALNGLEFMGRPIVANEARPREDNGNRDNNRGGGHHRKSRFDNNRDGNRNNRGNSIA